MGRGRTIINRLRDAWRGLGRPPEGRVYDYDPTIDNYRSTITKDLTCARLDTILRNGDDGDINDALELFEAIERSDGRVASVACTRRSGLLLLDWEIISAADKYPQVQDKTLADEAAAYVREKLDEIPTFGAALAHLARAIGPNLAALELVWEYGEVTDFEPIPVWRLAMKPHESSAIRVITAEERTYGIEAASPKFVVHVPAGRILSPTERAISRSQAIIWLLKKLALSDWGAFCELFGMPVRVGKYDPSVSDAEKRALKNMVENIGSRAWAIVSRAVDVEFVESSQRTSAPFEGLINWLNRETGVLWLGANLTSDTTGGTGTYAAASVQDDIRMALAAADVKAEADTVRQQILAPMVHYKFPLHDVPVPFFERHEPDRRDALQKLSQLRMAQQLGMKIGSDWAYEALGIKKPEAEDVVLEPPDAFEEGLREGMGPAFGGEMPEAGAAEGGVGEISINELTLGIERAKRAGDDDLKAKLKAVLDRMLAGMS